MIDQTLDVVWRAVDRKMRIGEPEIDALELLAVSSGVGRELEEPVERNDRLAVRRALADDAGPHGVVKFGVVVVGPCGRSPFNSFLPTGLLAVVFRNRLTLWSGQVGRRPVSRHLDQFSQFAIRALSGIRVHWP